MSIPYTPRTSQPPHNFSDLPQTIRERLHGANVHTFEQWLGLGKHRYSIWGITSKMAKELDELAGVMS